MSDALTNTAAPAAPVEPETSSVAAAPAASALPPEELDRMTDDIVASLKTVYDPEIPADIYELGLIYRVDIADDRSVTVDLAAQLPAKCPCGWRTP
jgi:hypothetical protein